METKEFQRWTAKRKVELLLQLIRGERKLVIERFFRSLKEECLWHHRFKNRDEAFLVIAVWLAKYHTERPHSALGYLTPREFAERLAA